jgi:hypothetical protein
MDQSFSLATGDEAAKPKRARAGRRASIEYIRCTEDE